MARYSVTLLFDGNRKDTVAKKVKEMFGADAAVQVEKLGTPESRSDRLGVCKASVVDAKAEVESLREELEEWKNNLPESLQGGTKDTELEEAINQLQEIEDKLEGVDWGVNFPGMY